MDSTAFLTLSTTDSGKTWTCSVAFAFDERFNLYFISPPDSRHMKNIEKDNYISVAIYSTRFGVGEAVFGVQMTGKTRIILEEGEAQTAYDCFYGRRYPETRKHPERTLKDIWMAEHGDL